MSDFINFWRLHSVFLLLLGISSMFTVMCAEPSPPENLEFDINILHGRSDLEPSVLKVKQGDTVTLKIISDKDGEFHLHGYDLRAIAKTGHETDISFVADATGKFDFEIHFMESAHSTHEHSKQDCHTALPTGAPVPKLKVTAGPSSEAGYIHVHVATENFLLQVEQSSGNIASGHWHLSINGDLKGMYVVSEKMIPVPAAGEYDVMVSLTDTDHCSYGIDYMAKVTVANAPPSDKSQSGGTDTHQHDEQKGIILGSIEVRPR